ncbi:MAG: ubiquinol-cytochrome c reductase iron-sulfur subunit [Planctomycetes bacterium]|nr:ubiquinol-cytochrome c reductase iron-sulfur subunit [Planctomycetota bacterium]
MAEKEGPQSREGGCGHHCPGQTDSTRRRFLKRLVGILTAPLVALLGWPLVQSVVGTMYRLPKATFTKVGSMSSFPQGEPVSPLFEMPRQTEYLHGKTTQDVWVIKHSDTEVTVFSPICPHLGCHYNWYSQAHKFICPCHGSVFSLDGKLLGGPAPRGLDTLPHKIEKGDLYVKWELFRVGIPQKIRIG